MRVLVVGHKGQLGTDLMGYARRHGIDALGAGRPEYDITRMETVERLFADAGPLDAVINAAAYTAVDRAESDAEAAYAVNRDGAGHLARVCGRQRIPLIHISTDYVFGGEQTRPCRPLDRVRPQGVYARSKADGEAAVRQGTDRHIILRVSWLFGLHGGNFVKTMLRLGKEREVIKVVDDQMGAPTYAGDLADACLQVAQRVQGGFTGWGTYHYSNQGALSWFTFAREILTLAASFEELAVREIVPITTADYPTAAPRPHYSVLDCTSFDQTFRIPRRSWETALSEMLTLLYTPKQA